MIGKTVVMIGRSVVMKGGKTARTSLMMKGMTTMITIIIMAV